MQTKEFDEKVREMVFNPYLLPKSEGYTSDSRVFSGFGENLLAKNTFKVYSLLKHIDEVMKDPAESIGWLCKKLGIICDIVDMDIEPIGNIYDNVHHYLLSDIDEETGAFWLFDGQEQATDFLDSFNKVEKYTDITLIGMSHGFDIIHNAELFADTVFGTPCFYHVTEKPYDYKEAEPFDEISSKYFRAVYAGIIYYWAYSNELLTNRLHIKNENKDNYQN